MRIAKVTVCLLLLGSGCGLVPKPDKEELEAQFNQRWRGKLEDDVVVQYGKPSEVLELSSGNHVDSYHRESFVATSRGGMFTNQYGGGGSQSSDARTVDCDRRFEIDAATRRVARAVITGSSCDYTR